MNHQSKATRLSFLLHILAALIIVFILRAEPEPIPEPILTLDLSLAPAPPPKKEPVETKAPEVKRRQVLIKKDKPTIIKPTPRVTPQPTRQAVVVPVPESSSVAEPEAAPPPVATSPAASATNTDRSAPKPDSAGSGGLPHEYAYLRGIISRNLKFPEVARRQRLTGIVIIAFLLRDDGRAEGINVVKSSGHEALDQAVTEAIRRSSPFPRSITLL